MKLEHVADMYMEWKEGKLPADRRSYVNDHLATCSKCCRFFTEADLLLASTTLSFLPHLTPDPYLPGRIRAEKEHTTPGTQRRIPWLRWALSGLATSVAVWLGVMLGTGVTHSSTSAYETKLATAYYQAFTQEQLTEEWDQHISAQGEQRR